MVSSRVGRLGSSGWAMILGPVPGAGRLAVGGCARPVPRPRRSAVPAAAAGACLGRGCRGRRRLGRRRSVARRRPWPRCAASRRPRLRCGRRRAWPRPRPARVQAASWRPASALGSGRLGLLPARRRAARASPRVPRAPESGAGATDAGRHRRLGSRALGHRRARELLLLAARGHLQGRAVGLEDPARGAAAARRRRPGRRAAPGRAAWAGCGGRCGGRGCRRRGAGRGLRRRAAAGLAGAAPLPVSARSASASSTVEAAAVTSMPAARSFVEHVRTGHALFLGDLVNALLRHPLTDSTRSWSTDTARRKARAKARRSTAVCAQAASQT